MKISSNDRLRQRISVKFGCWYKSPGAGNGAAETDPWKYVRSYSGIYFGLLLLQGRRGGRNCRATELKLSVLKTSVEQNGKKTEGRKLLPLATSMKDNYQHYRRRKTGPQRKGFHLEDPTFPERFCGREKEAGNDRSVWKTMRTDESRACLEALDD